MKQALIGSFPAWIAARPMMILPPTATRSDLALTNGAAEVPALTSECNGAAPCPACFRHFSARAMDQMPIVQRTCAVSIGSKDIAGCAGARHTFIRIGADRVRFAMPMDA